MSLAAANRDDDRGRAGAHRGTIGGSVAHADPAGDCAGGIIALDAEIKIVGPNGERWVKCDDFFLGLPMSVLEPDEIVTAIKVPVPAPTRRPISKPRRAPPDSRSWAWPSD